jgi:predicted DNA-binding transcriptional regulator YafY
LFASYPAPTSPYVVLFFEIVIMANSKQLRRYYLIYQCVSKQRFPSKVAIKAFLKDQDIPIDDRTLDRDINSLRHNFMIWPEYSPEHNGYYFNKEELKEASGVLRFLELAYLADNLNQPKYTKYISYGEVDLLKGIEQVPKILEAIDNRRVISFDHENYQNSTIKATLLEPYLIREYLNRWYVIGFKHGTQDLRTFGIDRITKLITLDNEFIRNDKIKLNSLFDHVIGVVYDANKLMEVEFKVPMSQKKYMDSLPLHKSQIHLLDKDEYAYYQMEVVHNYELEQKLLMHSIFLTVTGPDHFVAYMAEKINEIHLRYKRQDLS